MPVVGDIFNTLLFAPIVNLVVFVIRILEASGIPGALGFAIILLTIGIRALIWPLMATQMKSAKKMADLKPHLESLKKKHGSDKQALAAAQMALYKEHGINPAAGCLPVLIQIPPMIAIYQVIFAFFEGDPGLSKINNVLYNPAWKLTSSPDLHFFGLNLAVKPSDFQTAGFLVLSVPVITGLLQFVQSKMMAPKPVKEYPSDSPKEKKEKESSEDTMVAVQSQMTYLMPVMIGYIAFTFPLGLVLYWNTLTLIGIWQQYRISGWGGLAGLINKAKGYSALKKS
ncbi:MAG TPA: YidC/Oxa1 family membrane protein insertase [Patescibacteria group bacterium]|nr:YidC/Oxa1 family membrane protein insertase [Patescibacteria group bacterium]